MTFLTLAWKSVLNRRAQNILMSLVLITGFAVLGVMASLYEAVSGKAGLSGDRRFAVSSKINITQSIPLSTVEKVRSVPGVERATFTQWFGGYYKSQRNFLIMFAVDPQSYMQVFDNLVLTVGDETEFQDDRTGLLVGAAIADRYDWEIGDSVILKSSLWSPSTGLDEWVFTVRGIFVDKNDLGADNTVLMHYEFLDRSRDVSQSSIDNVIFTISAEAEPDVLASRIDALFKDERSPTRTTSLSSYEASFATQLKGIGLIITATTLVALLSMLLIVGSVIAISVSQRATEIGVLKAIGFSNRRLSVILVVETIIIILFGAIIGLLAARTAVDSLRSSGSGLSTIHFDLSIFGFGLAAAMVMALLCVIFPMLSVFRADVVEILRKG